MEEDEVVALHHLFEAARPKSVKGEQLEEALEALYNEALKNFQKLLKRPDGSRIFQLIFRRGKDKLRTKFLEELKPYIYEAATVKYSKYIIITIIKRGNAKQRGFIFDNLKGKFDLMLSHLVGRDVLEVLYENTTAEQKNRMMLDFFGPEWKNSKVIKTFDEICEAGGTTKTAAITSLTNCVKKAIDKQCGHLRITQKLMMLLGKQSPEALRQFATDFKEFAFTNEGSQVAIIALNQAKDNEVRIALKLIEDVPRVTVIQDQGKEAGGEEGEVNEEEDVEDVDDDEMEEDKAEPTEVPSTKTAAIAIDHFGWRTLSCAISHLKDLQVLKDEIFPNLIQDWAFIKSSQFSHKVLLRLISVVPSVFNGLQFQEETVNDDVVELTVDTFLPYVIRDIDSFGMNQDGSTFAATMLNILKGRKEFGQLLDAIITEEHIVDKVLHKLVKKTIQIVGAEAADKALEKIESVGLGDVLKTPGAWIVVELARNDKDLENRAKEIIKTEKIEGPAIQKIIHPSNTEAPVKPKRRNIRRNK
ncbi:protein penguin [Histomonas meleagridis]|uniref:protein penguin n=1 Tax=Histomonas meleagridis TaxID=135588 RepID=UPI003559FABC|nr:protein penguin [Histomonas meleagridis]KAH0806147.1 protein penguin [Histomonas meleagridis]